jgi:hypothetical protein
VIFVLIHQKNWESFGETCFPSVNSTTFAKALAHFEYITIKKIELRAALLVAATSDNQLFLKKLFFHMIFNNSSLFMSMSNLI